MKNVEKHRQMWSYIIILDHGKKIHAKTNGRIIKCNGENFAKMG